MSSLLRLGTRGSKLALVQAHETADRLARAHPALATPDAVEIVPITTTGDSVQNRLLSEIGGKGLFTKEIDEALLAGRIDIAVHSMKDLPTMLPAGTVIGAVLPREDPRDALIGAARLAGLAQGATLGTASLRRAAQAKSLRPDLVVVPLRGNVDTRLRKIAAGEAKATLLAVAGLKRLGMLDQVGGALEPEEMLPRSPRAPSRSPAAPVTPACWTGSPPSTIGRAGSGSPPSVPCWKCSTAPAARRSRAWPRSPATRSAFAAWSPASTGSGSIAANAAVPPPRPRRSAATSAGR